MTTVKTPPLPSGVTEMSLIFRFGYWESVRSLPSQALTLSMAPPASPEASGLWNRKTRVSEATRSIDLNSFREPAAYPADTTKIQSAANPPTEGEVYDCRGSTARCASQAIAKT